MRKNIFRTVIASVLVASMLVIPAFAESATVTGSAVNFRTGPGTDYEVIDCLPGGTVVEVTDRSGSWYAVSYNGQSGYISANYLSVSKSGDYAVTGSDAKAGYVNAMFVCFRSEPSSSASVLGTYNTGKALTITGTSGDWTAVTIDGTSGFVFSKYVTAGSPVSSSGSSSGSSQAGSDNSSSAVVSNSGSVIIIGSGVSQAPSATPAPAESPAPTPAPSAGSSKPSDGVIIIPAPSVNNSKPADQTTDSAGNDAPTASTPAETVPAETPGTGGNVTAEAQVKGSIKGDYVRFRSGPATTYTILGTYNSGKSLSVLGEEGEWTKCTIDGSTGYVFSRYVLKEVTASVPSVPSAPADTQQKEEEKPADNSASAGQNDNSAAVTTPAAPAEEKTGYITGNNVRFRSGPGTGYDILGEFFFGNSVTIKSVSGSWTAVKSSSGKEGYVYSDYVKEGSYTPSTVTTGSGSTTVSGSKGNVTGADIVNTALKYVGYNYRWGGADPSTGFDCSGLVYYVYGQYGYTLNRVAGDQANNGVHVDANALQPGDVLCFYSGSDYIGHVGIYIGDNKFVHAANSTSGVIISDISGYYATRGFEARRILA